ncbi:MAG: 2-polyprenyl-3-methyl-5-hydroxy-6-metoxy-1,4-benzoquinol methylase [Desulforhopalus sp.]|jgi:2-polyprenyl-3-methyl-5-hydroxy-6-metoxy-1,4-benzoquinol methylase
MTRDYQHNYSALKPAVFNTDRRNKKATTIVRVCQDFVGSTDLSEIELLDVGSSSGIIDNYLADHFGQVIGIDIDAPAIAHAKSNFGKPNLHFEHGDAMQIERADDSIDAVVCTQIYEHVPDASRMLNEIFRVLRPGGFCYFAGNNRIMIMEPHYRLPFLSVIPRPMAHQYVRLSGKGDYYHEKHYTRQTLKRLCSKFRIVDYTEKVIADPEKFSVAYMLKPGSLKWQVALAVARYAKWATPLIWVLQKPSNCVVE